MKMCEFWCMKLFRSPRAKRNREGMVPIEIVCLFVQTHISRCIQKPKELAPSTDPA